MAGYPLAQRGAVVGAGAAPQGADRATPGDDPTGEFSALYEETFDAVYRYATVLAGDATVAEDIAAEVYFRAWRSRGSYRGEGSQLSWLLSITHNTAATLLKRRARERADGETVERESGAVDGPERSAEASADRSVLLTAIRQLTPEQQQVVVLRFFGDWSHGEIASKLDRREDAVRALQYRALKQLRKILQTAPA